MIVGGGARAVNKRGHRAAFYEVGLRRAAPTVADARETSPCAIGLLLLARGDPRQAIIYAANLGHDADATASTAGAVAGAIKGADALRSDWVAKVTAAVPGQEELARRLAEVTLRRSVRTRESLADLDRLQVL